MRSALILILTCISLSGTGAGRAQPYPTHPVTLIVPYGAGGPLDTLTRIVSERLTQIWKRQIVVLNRPGAGGLIAAQAAASEKLQSDAGRTK